MTDNVVDFPAAKDKEAATVALPKTGGSASLPPLVEVVALNGLSGEKLHGQFMIAETEDGEPIYDETRNDQVLDPGCDFRLEVGEKGKIARKHAFAYYRDGNAEILNDKVRAEFDAELAKLAEAEAAELAAAEAAENEGVN